MKDSALRREVARFEVTVELVWNDRTRKTVVTRGTGERTEYAFQAADVHMSEWMNDEARRCRRLAAEVKQE